jgi:SprT-like protein
MSDKKPTVLMMKCLYAMILEIGEQPDSQLAEISYHEALDWIQKLKLVAKTKSKEFHNDTDFHEYTIRTIDTKDNNELDWIGNKLSLKFFGRPCKVPIEWEKSLKKAAGFFSFEPRTRKPIRIVQSMWQYNEFGAQHVIGTLKHELAHYHLFLQGQPFRDEDDVFKQECRRIGAPLYALSMREGYETKCPACGAIAGLEKKKRDRLISRCCKKPLHFGPYAIIFPDGLRVEVQK